MHYLNHYINKERKLSTGKTVGLIIAYAYSAYAEGKYNKNVMKQKLTNLLRDGLILLGVAVAGVFTNQLFAPVMGKTSPQVQTVSAPQPAKLAKLLAVQ